MLAALVGVGVAFGLGAAARPLASTEPLVALVSRPGGSALVRVDPATLAPVDGPRVDLAAYVWPWAYSPDRSRVALYDGRAIEIVDLAAMRVVRRSKPLGTVGQLAWLSPRRLVALYRYAVAFVDPATGRVVRRAFFDGEIVTATQAGARLLALVAPYTVIGRPRLLVADGSGRVRTVMLRRIRAGRDTQRLTVRTPALAADVAGSRLFVLGGDGPVAEVDLRKLSVHYHTLGRSFDKAPLLGPTRYAAWLGGGLIAVAGEDGRGKVVSGELHSATVPSGLQLVDTRSWTVRTLDPGATRTAAADGRVIAYGVTWGEDDFVGTGMGLAIYARDGSRVAHLFGSTPIQRVQIVGSRAFVDGQSPTSVVDLDSGAVVGQLPGFAPDLLVGDSREWSG